MKAKILTAAISALMLISLISVFQAGTASATEQSYQFAHVADGTAGWTTEEAHSGSYSVRFHAVNWGLDGYALGIPVDVPLNGITTLSYWRNGVGFEDKDFVDYAPPAVLLCIDANSDGKLDFNTQDALDVLMDWGKSSLLGDDAIFGIEGDWIATDNGWTKVNGLTNSFWLWGGAWCLDKVGWPWWGPDYLPCTSLQDFTGSGTIGPTDNVMMVVIMGCNPDGDLYIDDVTINDATHTFEPPEITLSPEEGISVTILSGQYFTPNAGISYTWDEDPIEMPLGPTEVGPDGRISAIIAVQTQGVPGEHTVAATDEFGLTASATFTVLDMKGDKGDSGNDGADGADGAPGLTGPQGSQGSTGAKGDTGDVGSQGPTGSQGPQGKTGSTGPKGSPGESAPTGVVWASILVAIIALLVAAYAVARR